MVPAVVAIRRRLLSTLSLSVRLQNLRSTTRVSSADGVPHNGGTSRRSAKPRVPSNSTIPLIQTSPDVPLLEPTPYLFIGNIPPRTQHEALRRFISSYGDLTHLRICVETRPGYPWLGYGFVDFKRTKSACRIVEASQANPNKFILSNDERDLPLTFSYNEHAAAAQLQEWRGDAPQDVKEDGREPYRKICARNLPWRVYMKDLKRYFKSWGPIKKVHLPYDISGQPRSYAFIEYADIESAQKAFEAHSADSLRVAPVFGSTHKLIVTYVDKNKDVRFRPRVRGLRIGDIQIDDMSADDVVEDASLSENVMARPEAPSEVGYHVQDAWFEV